METKTILLLLSCTLIGFLPFNSAPKHSVHVKYTTDIKNRSIAELTKNLEFDFCKANIRPNDNQQLNEVAAYVKDKKLAIALRGHADAIGSYVGNWKMSDYRANSVKDYLISKGVPEDRIITTPFGSTVPIASNKSAAGRQKNRRVEIRLNEVR